MLRALEGTSHPFACGDMASLEQLLVEHREEVACIIMEPMRSEEPSPGYLAQVRALADEHGVLLVFDEVSSGKQTARVVEQSFAIIRQALESNALDTALEGPVQEDLFRRLVH